MNKLLFHYNKSNATQKLIWSSWKYVQRLKMKEDFILILTISQRNNSNFCYYNEYGKENAKKNKEWKCQMWLWKMFESLCNNEKEEMLTCIFVNSVSHLKRNNVRNKIAYQMMCSKMWQKYLNVGRWIWKKARKKVFHITFLWYTNDSRY